ncbi:hypothetical protein D3C73_981100 [compost metagenome]
MAVIDAGDDIVAFPVHNREPFAERAAVRPFHPQHHPAAVEDLKAHFAYRRVGGGNILGAVGQGHALRQFVGIDFNTRVAPFVEPRDHRLTPFIRPHRALRRADFHPGPGLVQRRDGEGIADGIRREGDAAFVDGHAAGQRGVIVALMIAVAAAAKA